MYMTGETRIRIRTPVRARACNSFRTVERLRRYGYVEARKVNERTNGRVYRGGVSNVILFTAHRGTQAERFIICSSKHLFKKKMNHKNAFREVMGKIYVYTSGTEYK